MAPATLIPTRPSERLSTSVDEPRFRVIMVGIDGSPAALEAARQAVALATPRTAVKLVGIFDDWSVGPTSGALMTEPRAREAVAEAEAELAGAQPRLESEVIGAHPAWKGIMAALGGADLVVVGRHGRSRLGGILMGATATRLLHHVKLPILVAAPPPTGSFLDRILVATDGDSSADALAVGDLIAARHRSELSVVHVEHGPAHREIADEAEREGSSLVIVGSRELTGIASLRSVSERVAHECPCSVLVMHSRRRGGAS